MGRLVVWAAVVQILAALGCDAPRDNPMDPALGGNIDGRILTRRSTPIAGAEVIIHKADRLTVTDSNGDFSLRGLPEDSLWVCASAEGYASDSVRVETRRGRIESFTRFLNGLPTLSSCRITTHVYGRGWPPEPLYFCRLSAHASDRDGLADVDSVWGEVPGIGFERRLTYDPDSGEFGSQLWSSALPGQSVETLVGMPVVFRAADFQGAISSCDPVFVSRVIYQLPQLAFPIGGVDTVRSDTTFSWRRFDPGYSVRYRGSVVRLVSGNPAGVVTEFDGAGPADTTCRIDIDLLLPGDYIWTVEAIDTYGNSSRSIEELFHAR